ncbi:hypothetical protein ACA910_002549 [Epithemia clementina (nom. ined.)]
MGCSISKSKKVLNQVYKAPPEAAVAGNNDDDDNYSSGKPRPLIFAIIRNGHEVVRGRLKDVEGYLQSNELELAEAEWRHLKTWFNLHRKMELGTDDTLGFLPLLDKFCGNIAQNENFYDEYRQAFEGSEELNAAFETNDLFQIKGVFYDYKDAILALLKKEDEILMPKVNDMAERNLNLKKFMKKEILAAISDSFGFESFLRYAFATLETHHGGMPRVRVYGHALWTVATPKQWGKWQLWIQESVSKQSFDELINAIAETKAGV